MSASCRIGGRRAPYWGYALWAPWPGQGSGVTELPSKCPPGRTVATRAAVPEAGELLLATAILAGALRSGAGFGARLRDARRG
jgi:hypothetical protein